MELDRIKELEQENKALKLEVLRQKGMVSCLVTMDEIQAVREPLSIDGLMGADEDTIKELKDDSTTYGIARDKYAKLRDDAPEEQVVVIDLKLRPIHKEVTLKEFNSQELQDEYEVDSRGELFELIEKVNGKQILTYALGDQEVEETKLIVGSGKYIEGIDFNEVDTFELIKGDA